MENQETGHKYFIERDVIATAGELAIKRIAEKGNTVYVNFDDIEQRAEDRRDKDQHAYGEVLKFINKNSEYDYEKKRAVMPSGGVISWDEPEKNVPHITKSPSIESKLRRKGKKVVVPKFLVYGHEVLYSGVQNINFNGNLEDITFDTLAELGIEEEMTMNNQFYIVNNRADRVLQLRHTLSSNAERTRFSINEDVDPRLVVVDPSAFNSKVPGYKARDLRQRLAYTNALNNNIEAHIIVGGSSSGKSVTGYAAAVHHILGNEKLRAARDIKDRIVLFKSNDLIGGKNREQGFLPGDAIEKDWNFMKSYADAHNLVGLDAHRTFASMLEAPARVEIKGGSKKDDKKSTSSKPQTRLDNKLGDFYLPARHAAIEVENLIYARGRTFENAVIIVDEAQNYTPFEMKHLIERMGVNSVIYLIGDPMQIDNPALTPDFNGLTYAANVFFKDHPRASIVNLDRSYRAQSSEIMRNQDAPRD